MRNILNTSANITTKKIKKKFNHKGVNILNVDIEYPYIKLSKSYIVQKKINDNYFLIAKKFYNKATKILLPMAIEQYLQSIKESYPFHPYDAVMKYTITQNSNCILSTYFDQYEYTGGAHGMTLRTSTTYSLQTGDNITLKNIFKGILNYKSILIDEIKKQAEKNILDNPGIYFENYLELIEKSFNENSFYLTEDAINIYYQQYDIAPYATGIVVFSLTYKELGIKPPYCKIFK